MEDLLNNEFTAYYGLPACNTKNLIILTNESYFELDDIASQIVLRIDKGSGMARFANPSKMTVSVANYDKFVTCLPNSFQRGKKRCDIILVCNADRYFVLGELKDSPGIRAYRKTAKKQLLESLRTLIDVPAIRIEVNSKQNKRCCYFNRQSAAPAEINAVGAFNRLPNAFPEGFKMNEPHIEALNFEFWEYTGVQTMTLT